MANQRRKSAPVVRRNGGEWDPLHGVHALMEWDPLQEMFPRAFGFAPAFRVTEAKEAYAFEADLPGFRDQDIDVDVTGNQITVSGKREAREIQDSDKHYCSSYGSFTRSFTLPDGIDPDGISAELKDGILSLRVPKKAEAQPRKRIPVRSDTAEKKQ